MDDNNIKTSSLLENNQVDTLGLDDDDSKSEIHAVGYEEYLKVRGIVLEPGDEFASMVGI